MSKEFNENDGYAQLCLAVVKKAIEDLQNPQVDSRSKMSAYKLFLTNDSPILDYLDVDGLAVLDYLCDEAKLFETYGYIKGQTGRK